MAGLTLYMLLLGLFALYVAGMGGGLSIIHVVIGVGSFICGGDGWRAKHYTCCYWGCLPYMWRGWVAG